MSICIKDQIQNMNLVIGCTVGCAYCYARNNVKRWHMIDNFADPEFFPGKLKMNLWQLTGNAAAFYYGVLWNKLYRRDLIQMAHIRFEHVVYAEDQLFNTRYLQVAQRFAAIDEAAYCYIQNPQSVCHTQVSAADMLRHRSRMYHTYKELCIQLGVYDKFRLRLHGIYLSLFESPLPNGPVQKLSDAFARTHSRI